MVQDRHFQYMLFLTESANALTLTYPRDRDSVSVELKEKRKYICSRITQYVSVNDNLTLRVGEQGWSSGESTRPHQCYPGFDSRTRLHMWVEFVVSSLFCSERFFSGFSSFPLSQKTNTWRNSNSIPMLRCLIHELPAREVGQPLLTLASLNRLI